LWIDNLDAYPSQEHAPPHHRSFHMQDGLARAEALTHGTAPSEPEAPLIETDIPARLERLWGLFHTLVVIALGSPGFSTDWK